MSQFGILSVFDHNSQSWRTYKNRINQWFIANDVENNEVKKRAILLSALSDGTYKLAADLALPKDLTEVPYEDIITLLDAHFTPKRKGFGDRFTFYAATHRTEESYAQWAARLRGLTADCKFQNVEEALRDRFLMGMLPGPEREKLYAQDIENLTLARAVELAESIKNARALTTTVGGEPTPANQLYKITKDPKSVNVNKNQCKECANDRVSLSMSTSSDLTLFTK